MFIQSIHFDKISFKKKKTNRTAKIMLPTLLLIGTPLIDANIKSDAFIKSETKTFIPKEIRELSSTNIAEKVGIDTKDYFIKRALKNKTITIDAGHGGTTKDQTTFSKPYGTKYYDNKNKKWIYEKDINLKIAKEIENILKQTGANIVMTRDSDSYITLTDRAEKANESKSNMFVSIHVNANKSKKINGPEIYLCTKSTKTDTQKAAKNLAEQLNKRLTTLYKINENKIRYVGFNVLKDTENIPGVLVETGYLTNQKDRDFLINEENQLKLAKEIAGGIIDFWLQKQEEKDNALFFAGNTKN
ncbi:MAG: N-acetylmuramoyl-L-alanine amidase [Clostridium sp.]|nr:N-acetylmuramoyl-L-alanine amidase [Clostridium sp.]